MRIASVVLIAVVSQLVAAPVPKELSKRKVYFPTAVGTKWVYATEDGTESQTREVTAVTVKDGVRLVTILWTASGQRQEWELREDGTGIYRSKMGAAAVDPPHLLLKPKVVPGDEWDGEYVQSGRTERYHRVVGKPETVKTPAGEYEAIPVVQTNPDDENDEATVWYAEGVGMVKLHQKYSTPLVLKQVTIGK